MTATDTTTFADATATSTASEEEAKAMKIDNYVPVFILAGQSNMVGRCDGRRHDCLPPNHLEDLKKKDLNIGFWYCNDINFDADMNAPSCCGNGWQMGKIKDALTLQYSPGLDMHLFGPEMALIPTLVSRLQQEDDQEQQEDSTGAADSSCPEHGVVNSNNKACYFIKFAMGSTNLHSNWNPVNIDNDSGTSPSKRAYYPLFVQHVRTALEQLRQELLQRNGQQQEPRLAGLFWLQGESDSSSCTKHAKAYGANLSRFVTAVRRDFQAPNLPIVASPIVWPRGRSAKKGKNNGEGLVNQALRQAGNSCPHDDDGKDAMISHYTCIDPLSPGLQVTQSADTGAPVGCADHLTAAALLDIGKRMGEAFVPLASLENEL